MIPGPVHDPGTSMTDLKFRLFQLRRSGSRGPTMSTPEGLLESSQGVDSFRSMSAEGEELAFNHMSSDRKTGVARRQVDFALINNGL